MDKRVIMGVTSLLNTCAIKVPEVSTITERRNSDFELSFKSILWVISQISKLTSYN